MGEQLDSLRRKLTSEFRGTVKKLSLVKEISTLRTTECWSWKDLGDLVVQGPHYLDAEIEDC